MRRYILAVVTLVLTGGLAHSAPADEPMGIGGCYEARPICIQGSPVCMCDALMNCFWACK